MKYDSVPDGRPTGMQWMEQSATQRRHWAATLIRQCLDNLSTLHREPDAWESGHLGLAIGCLVSRSYAQSILAVEVALTPVNHRHASLQSCQFHLSLLALRFGLNDALCIPMTEER